MYVASPSIDIANTEMDLDQDMINGQTAIYGFQLPWMVKHLGPYGKCSDTVKANGGMDSFKSDV